jgi:hypothetical protein
MFIVTSVTASLLANLSLKGLKAINLEWFDHNEKWIMGVAMIIIAAMMFVSDKLAH